MVLILNEFQSNSITLLAQTVKNLSAEWEIWLPSLGHGDPLEDDMATHSNILSWRIPWAEEPNRLQSRGLQHLDTSK